MLLNIYKRYNLLLLTTTILTVIPTSISRSEEPNEQVSESWGFTDIKVLKFKYTWTINNYKFCCQEPGDYVVSAPFITNDGCEWFLRIYPRGVSEYYRDSVSLYLYTINCKMTTTFKLTILNPEHKVVSSETLDAKFAPAVGNGLNNFTLQRYIFNEENDVLPYNHLIVICEIITTLGGKNYVKQFVQPKSHLTEHFELLLDNEVFTDVTLMAGEKKFKAHKAILAARSPIFKAMFENDDKKSDLNVVELTNIDPQTLGKMLRYIYTDKAADLEKVAPNLLAAADNYQLDGLKTLCENTLRANLCVENAIDFFILGDKYSASDLKTEAKKFIVDHILEIKEMPKFKSLILAQPHLAKETFALLG